MVENSKNMLAKPKKIQNVEHFSPVKETDSRENAKKDSLMEIDIGKIPLNFPRFIINFQ